MALVSRLLSRILLAVCLLGASAYGQTIGPNTGATSFGASDDHDIDSINLATLVPTLHFPVISKPGSFPFELSIVSAQSCWITQQAGGPAYTCIAGGVGPAAFNATVTPSLIMSTSYYMGGSGTCANKIYEVNGLIDSGGTYHAIPLTPVAPSPCGSGATVTTTDGSGIAATLDTGADVLSATTPNGYSGTKGFGGAANIYAKDPFGNQLSSLDAFSNGTLTTTFTDTLNNTTVNIANGTSTYAFNYTDSNGTGQSISYTSGSSVTFEPYLQGTCNTRSPNPTVSPLSAINYPDGTSYSFTQDQGPGGSGHTSGLIGSVTLRTGGTISYAYTPHTPTNCTVPQWTFSALSRTTPDGTTNYSTSNGVTTVLDPGKNKSVYTFVGDNPGCSGIYCVSVPVIAQIQRYQNTGTVASPVYTLISTDTYCYNGNQTNCATTSTTFPITQRDSYHQIAGMSTSSRTSENFDSYGNIIYSSKFDFGASTYTLQTVTTYGSWNGTSCVAVSSTIHDHPCDVKVTDSTPHTISETRNTYNSHGALTASSSWSGSSWLTTNYTPNANGTIASVTAPNGQVMNYSYAATGSGGCNGLLLTGTSTTVNSVNINTGKTWDCNTGLVLTTTDANGNGTVAQYDSMLRPSLVQDQTGYQTTFSYTATSSSSNSSFTGVVHNHITYVDILGRPIISQTLQGPGSSNYDTVSTSYGWNGTNFQTQTSVACSQTSDQHCSTVAITSLANPVFGPVSTADVNGGTTTYAQNQNDSSVTAGPAPSGEHTKVAQVEVDGLGRTKSTCGLQPSGGGTACGQVMGGSGILTSNTYSFGAGSSTVTTARGAQTHTTVTDALGRVTSVQTPEAGTVTSYYDTIPSQCYQSGVNESGFLTAVKDNAGNYICTEIDGIGRVYAQGGGSPAAAGTPCRRFAYDSTANVVNGSGSAPSGYPSSGANLKGRLMEAETDNCNPPRVSITDEWFAYNANGQITDVWELTPRSTPSYYHTYVTYNADGSLATLTGFPHYSTFTWGVDGEGRYNAFNDGTTTIVDAAGFTYDAASRPLAVPTGNSGDQDAYQYDSLGNMRSYNFQVNGKYMFGSLIWNQDGSLKTLSIDDSFNSGGSQTCNFLYDDVARLITDNCGSESSSVPNPDFEAGNTGWGLGSGYSIVNNPSNAEQGSWYLSGTSTTDTASGENNNTPIAVSGGATITYGGWVNRVSGTGNISYGCAFWDSSMTFLGWCPSIGTFDTSIGAGWNYYENSYTLPSNAAYVRPYAEIHCCGDSDNTSTTAYFDASVFSTSSSGLFNQTYAYGPSGTDPGGQYENLSKSGTISWNPGYDLTTNRMNGNGAVYDSNGRPTMMVGIPTYGMVTVKRQDRTVAIAQSLAVQQDTAIPSMHLVEK